MRREIVLVVEDDPACRDVISEILADAGYDCLQADGGRAAIELMARRPNVLLTDLLMPDKDGVEVIMEVRRRWPMTRIVAMSGGFAVIEADALLRTATMLGAGTALRKPFTSAQLLDRVSAALLARRP
ncbi:response regulator [Phenylobacterium sp.]|uniref:response regulator n=1 Tax=Phenylobacterium sp. TaxID=1871053 RepID=UPI0035C7D925